MTLKRSARPLFALTAACVAMMTALAPVHAGAAEVKNHVFRGTLLGGKTLENPCGLAVTAEGDILVSDYDNNQVGRWAHLPPNSYGALIENVAPSSGPCGLALDAAGNLYVNRFHGAVVRYGAPGYASGTVIDSANATGVAVDNATGDLYVDERTSVAVYKAPVTAGAPSFRIGVGSLENAYGLARSAASGRLFVADAATHTVKVFDPLVDPDQPAAAIDGAGTAAGRFASLVDAGLAIDQSNDHLFVADNTQPGFEHPRAAVSEFNSDGVFRGELARVAVSGAPVGIAVNESPTSSQGEVYVTTGNGQSDVLGGFDPEQASAILVFGPAGLGQLLQVTRSGAGQGAVASSPAGIACPGSCEAEFNSGAKVTLTATPAPGSFFAGWSGACTGTGTCQVELAAVASVDAAFELEPAALGAPNAQLLAASQLSASSASAGEVKAPPGGRGPGAFARAEIVQQGGVRVAFDGELSPRSLPRSRPVPVKVAVAAEISSTDRRSTPQLQRISIAINRYGRLDATGLPLCRLEQIQPATTEDALKACRRSLVGEGTFSAEVLLKGQAPFPSRGKVYAFNARLNGRPAILAHVFGTDPAPTSYTIPFVVTRAKGTFGSTLTASLPEVTPDAGSVTGLSLKLGKTYRYRGKRRSYLSASCPAPMGSHSAIFPFAKAEFGFAGGRTLASTLIRTCQSFD